MDFYKEQLLKFRDLNLSKRELMDTVPKNFESDEPILISNSHVIYLLESYKNNKIVEPFLLDWVNTIWVMEW